MNTNSQPNSYNDLQRLAGEALTQAITEAKNTPTLNQRLTTLETAYDTSTEATAARLKEHDKKFKETDDARIEANRRANWQDQRIADLSDKLRNTQICLTLTLTAAIILTLTAAIILLLATVISSFFH